MILLNFGGQEQLKASEAVCGPHDHDNEAQEKDEKLEGDDSEIGDKWDKMYGDDALPIGEKMNKVFQGRWNETHKGKRLPSGRKR
ncbi:MAG: hypothetical protein WC310_04525 [Patescibacteria group bacterium]|jgi:hypothetical protein